MKTSSPVLKSNTVKIINLKADPFTLVSGGLTYVMAWADSCGLMAQDMKGTGSVTRPTAEASSFILMEMSMKATGLTIRLKVRALTNTKMGRSTPENGRMTFNTVSVSKLGRKEVRTRVSTCTGRRTEEVSMSGQTVQCI